jgi:hypothetical protein
MVRTTTYIILICTLLSLSILIKMSFVVRRGSVLTQTTQATVRHFEFDRE